MKKNLLLFLLFLTLFLSQGAQAQWGGYWLTTSQETYTPLSGATTMNGTTAWDHTQRYSAAIGFPFKVDTATTNVFYFFNGNSFSLDTSTNPLVQGFLLIDALLIDRGVAGGSSLSPLRYTTTGTAGSRIFKLELSNAGFAQEDTLHGTLNDYINMQIWLYEGTNVVELRYGPSQLTYPTDYFAGSGGSPAMGYLRRNDLMGNGTLYMPSGIYPGVSMDSVVFNSYATSYVGQAFLGNLDGMVFHFKPYLLGTKDVTVNNAKVYPTSCSDHVNVYYPGTTTTHTTYTVLAIDGAATGINGTLQNGITHIDISKLPQGMYLLQLQNSTGKSVNKFVKI